MIKICVTTEESFLEALQENKQVISIETVNIYQHFPVMNILQLNRKK